MICAITPKYPILGAVETAKLTKPSSIIPRTAVSEQMASPFLFTNMQGSEKRESNLLETPHFRRRERTGGVFNLFRQKVRLQK